MNNTIWFVLNEEDEVLGGPYNDYESALKAKEESEDKVIEYRRPTMSHTDSLRERIKEKTREMNLLKAEIINLEAELKECKHLSLRWVKNGYFCFDCGQEVKIK